MAELDEAAHIEEGLGLQRLLQELGSDSFDVRRFVTVVTGIVHFATSVYGLGSESFDGVRRRDDVGVGGYGRLDRRRPPQWQHRSLNLVYLCLKLARIVLLVDGAGGLRGAAAAPSHSPPHSSHPEPLRT